MIVNQIVVPLSEYCSIVGRIERHGSIYSATLSWTGEFFAGEEVISRTWKETSYEDAHDSICRMVAGLERRFMELDRGIVRFSEGDDQAY